MGFWKTLGKIGSIAAPIIAAPFTGGATLALIGAGAGAAGGALQNGKKGALLGGLLGGATEGLAGGAGNAANVAKTGASEVAKQGIGSTIKNIGGNLVTKLLSGDVLDAAGKGVAGVASTEAHNRGTKLDAMMEADKMKALTDQYNREAAQQGMKQMQIASYLAGGGYQPVDQPVLANGRTATKFDFGTRPASDAEKAYGAKMQTTLQDRLDHPLTVSDYTSQMDPGTMEKTMNWLAPILTTVGAARGAGKYQPPYNAPQNVPITSPTPTVALPPVEFKIPTSSTNPYAVFGNGTLKG